MKTLLFAPFILLALLCTIDAQQPKPAKKPPVGIPVDATLFNGKWYRLYLEKGVTWHRAKEKCEQLGGQLVTVPDAATWEFLKTMVGGVQLWLGSTCEVTVGIWKWVDGTPVKYSAWRAGEPNNAGGKEYHLATYKGGWADCPNSGVVGTTFRAQGFICEWRDK